jgi:DNA-binding NarL/FixJ family response regulator
MNSRTVLLYGQSLLLSGVAASLAECPGMQVARAATWAEAGRRLAERVPDVLIFDLTNSNESHILPLLLKNPGLLLIGLDTESNQAVLVSGQQAQSLTLNQIREIAEGKTR